MKELFLIILVLFIPILPAYAQMVSWDQSLYRIGEIGVVSLESKEANKNPAIIDLAYVWIYSDTDPNGLQLLVLETGSNSSLFKSYVEFGNFTNDSTLEVSSGDSVFAKYDSVEATAKIEGIVESFTVQLDSAIYQKGDTIKIEGTISNKEYDSNLLVVVQIFDPLGEVVFSSQKSPTSQGTYSTFANVGGPSWKRIGDYTVLSQYGSLKAEAHFTFSGLNPSYNESYEEHPVPWGLTAKPVSSSQIELRWNPPTQTFGLDIVGYNINEKIGKGMYEEITTTGVSTNYLISGLEVGKTYTFVVQARYSVGISEVSNEASATTLAITSDAEPIMQSIIPEWIRNNAKWWAEGTIDDSDFISGIQYLIQKEIMSIPDSSRAESAGSQNIPEWIRTNAGWWSQGLISDGDFVKGIQYLINQGIIVI